ncbi:hypothetical protein [Streptomyces sp. NPDC090445]|uniref:DUF7144 family membrane protein n=1 Tax=Streptomyces sp. NPDC090445 TaxID=3365963 RepID=UPI0037FBDD5D
MTTTPTPAAAGKPGAPHPWATGGTVLAGILMVVNGVFAIIEGISAIAQDDIFYTRIGDYIYKFSLTGWGWIHLILGIVVLIVGIFLLKGANWARIAAIVLASLTVIVHFLWLPYQPLWSLVVIAVAVFIIWALCTDKEPLGW